MLESAQIIMDKGLEDLGRFYSVYRAVVVDNQDPESLNRLKVAVPTVQGGIVLWAFSRNQHGSINSGFKHLAPKVGDIVYVTFEFGDPSKPLWEYHGWGKDQIPDILDNPNTMGFVTPNGNRVWLDDDNGTLTVYTEGDINVISKGSVGVKASREIFLNSNSKIVANGGENLGVIKIAELTEKLNKLVQEVNLLRETYNKHVHPSNGATTPAMVQKPISKFEASDYEDTKFVH